MPEEAAVPDPPEPSIAMWGTPGSGKTTFLGALNIALTRARNGWKVIGADDASTAGLSELTSQLTSRRRFPKPTTGMERYHWYLVGSEKRRVGPRLWRRRSVRRGARIGLNLLDPAGELFGADGAGHVNDDLVDHLLASRAIVFLFDPVNESETGMAYDYLHAVLSKLGERMLEHPRFKAEGVLPHHIAVCVTKFDDLRVLESAEQLQLLSYDMEDHGEFPLVEGDDAQLLFKALCEVSATGNAELVLNTLEQYFDPERIRYFVTSAIGFYADPYVGTFDRNDPQNLILDSTDPSDVRIRGAVNPINVMEPVMWLGERLAGGQGGPR